MTTPVDSVDVERFRQIVSGRLGLNFDDSKLPFLADVLKHRQETVRQGAAAYLGRLESAGYWLDELRALSFSAIVPATILQFPKGDVLDVILFRNDGAAGFQNKDVESLFGEFFGGPATSDTGTNDERVVGVCCHVGLSLSLLPFRNMIAATEGTGYNFELEFLGKADF